MGWKKHATILVSLVSLQSAVLALEVGDHLDSHVATLAPTDAPVGLPSSSPSIYDPNVIEWKIQSYDDRVVKVGETVTFNYGPEHNVYIHPTSTCDDTYSILVGDIDDGTASYTFANVDAGRKITFASDVSFDCEAGQMISFQVEFRDRKEPPKGASKEGLKLQRKSPIAQIFGNRGGDSKEGLKLQQKSPTAQIFGSRNGSIRGGGRRLSKTVPEESS